MKNLFLTVCFIVASVTMYGQKTDSVSLVDPRFFPIETDLSNIAIYSREDGNNVKVMVEQILIEAGAKDGGTVTFIPSPTGNAAQYRNTFVTASDGSLYFIDINGNSVQFGNGGSSNDADADPSNELQTISKVGSVVTLSDNGGQFTDEVNDADSDPANEIQTVNKTGSTVTLSNNGGQFTDEVNDADADPNNEFQTINKAGNTVTLSNGGGSFTDEINDADSDPSNELQTITKTGSNVTLSNNGGTFSIEDNDSSTSNEIQVMSKTGNTVSLSLGGGTFTDEVNDADSDPNNEIQTFMLLGETLVLSGGGGSEDLSGLNTDNQTLSLLNDLLSISNGNNVDLSPYATDEQVISFDNSTSELSISGTNGGNTIVLPLSSSGGDLWGSQVAETGNSLEGNGTSASPLDVKISQESGNNIEIKTDGIFSSGGGSSEITYFVGNAKITATGPGVTYQQVGGIANVEIPIGVNLKYIAINETYNWSNNNYVVRIIDRNGVANSSESDFMPLPWVFIKRDNLGVVPPTDGLSYQFTQDNPPTSRMDITGYGNQSGGGTYIQTTFRAVDSYGNFTVASFCPF